MKIVPFRFKSHQKLILRIALSILFLFFGIYFVKHEKSELLQVETALYQANRYLILAGVALVVAFVFIQGFMYQYSFKALKKNITLKTGILLYLKRNFISVFIPAGIITNMFFFNKSLVKQGIEKTYIYYASTLFSIASVASSIVIALPAVVLFIFKGGQHGNFLLGTITGLLVLALLFMGIRNIIKRGAIYRFIEANQPALAGTIDDLRGYAIDKRQLLKVFLLSIGIEIIGVGQLYISMLALHMEPSITVAVIGYAMVLVILFGSPFLKGIGAIELSLTYALTLFGYSAVSALSVAFLFRFFEFWSVLLLGLFALVLKRDNMLFRFFPSFMLFALGLVNIISAVTPILPERLHLLKEFVPLSAIETSKWFVFFAGFFILIVAAYLVKGLKNAWTVAVFLTSISLVAHLTKGIDWEESFMAILTLFSLLFTKSHYFIRRDTPFSKQLWFPGITIFFTVWLFGTFGFYFLNYHHFDVNFTFWQSCKESIKTLLLLDHDVKPLTSFSRTFLFWMHTLGVLTFSFCLYAFFKPLINKKSMGSEANKTIAKQLVAKYSNGSLDYFKTYFDKSLWIAANQKAFVSYRVAGSFAVVLENPVMENLSSFKEVIASFEKYCRESGLKTCYYRVPEQNTDSYTSLNKKILPIGIEATVNLEAFTMEGQKRKSLRNAVHKIETQGFEFKIFEPPHQENFLRELQGVSTNWLSDMQRSEMAFSQGIFLISELQNQPIGAVVGKEGKIVAFVNIIPSFKPGEGNFDLMRKTAEAPNGTMDFLFVNLFAYFKEKGFSSCNLGMVPLSGIDEPQNFPEYVIRLAYEKIKAFSHYKDLYNYKEKFDPDWTMQYLIYNDSYDLISLPRAIKKVIHVKKKY